MSFVRSTGLSGFEAEDIFQETMVACYTNLCENKYDHHGNWEGYVFGIIRNQTFKYISRRKLTYSPIDEAKLCAVADSVEEHIIEQENGATINHLLSSLNELDKFVVSNYYLNEFAINGIAEAINCTPVAVRNRKAKALKKMRRYLQLHSEYHEIAS